MTCHPGGNEASDADHTQTRGQGVSEQDKYRVTLELCQCVEGYFDSAVEPRGRALPSALVLVGARGGLSNISDEATFVKDEHFTFRGKEVLRRAGSSPRGVLQARVHLRLRASHTQRPQCSQSDFQFCEGSRADKGRDPPALTFRPVDQV